MEIVRTVLYTALAALFPVGAVALAVRYGRRVFPPGQAWCVFLRGEGAPYPVLSVRGHLVVVDRLVWIANSEAGEIDLSEAGLHIIRTELRPQMTSQLVCVDGLGVVVRLFAP